MVGIPRTKSEWFDDQTARLADAAYRAALADPSVVQMAAQARVNLIDLELGIWRALRSERGFADVRNNAAIWDVHPAASASAHRRVEVVSWQT